jgi:hypothetical protein
MKKIAENVAALSTYALLRLFSILKNELSLRQYRYPVADRAVRLVAQYLSAKPMSLSNKGFDLLMQDGGKVEVKARCISSYDGGRALASDIRCLDEKLFDWLAMVIFHSDMTVSRAFLVPHRVVLEKAYFSKHSNAWRFYVQEELLLCLGVKEITRELQALEDEESKSGIHLSFAFARRTAGLCK